MTKTAAVSIYGKTLTNPLLRNHLAALKSWYVSYGETVFKSLYKWWTWVDLDLFDGKLKVFPLGFCKENVEKVHFLVANVLFDMLMHFISTLMEF